MNRPTFSICTGLFNAVRMGFAWQEALSNWLSFLDGDGQLVVAINTSDDGTPEAVRAWVARWQEQRPDSGTRIDVLDIAVPYDLPDFDGRGKAAATDAATQPYVIFLDADERLVPAQRRKWDVMARELEASSYEAFLVPVVDLMGDEEHYKAGHELCAKWYIHKRLPHLTRGVNRAAWNPDGKTWRTDLSDSCDLIHRETGELARAAAILMPLPHYLTVPQLESGEVPFVTHLGWLNQEQRLRQSAFWRGVWDARAGEPGKEPEMTVEKLEAIPRYRHHLPSWKERA